MTLEEIIIEKIKYIFQIDKLYKELNRINFKEDEVAVDLFGGSSSEYLKEISDNDHRRFIDYKSIEMRFAFTGDENSKPYYSLTKEQYDKEIKQLQELNDLPFWKRISNPKKFN